MTDAASPTVFLLRTCPFCLKLRIFLTEAGLADRVAFVAFDQDDDQHQDLRARMQAAGQQPSFPAAELSPGELTTGTDALIAHFAGAYSAGEGGVDPESLPLLQYYSNGVFAKYLEMFGELRELKSTQPG